VRALGSLLRELAEALPGPDDGAYAYVPHFAGDTDIRERLRTVAEVLERVPANVVAAARDTMRGFDEIREAGIDVEKLDKDAADMIGMCRVIVSLFPEPPA